MTETTTNIAKVSREEGVSDLPGMVKALFAKALLLERQGDTVGASEYLEKALAAEERNRQGK